MRIDLRFNGRQLIALDRAVVAEVEAQALWRHDRTGLMHVGAEDFPQCGVHQVRCGMVTLDVSPPRFVHLSDRRRGLERFAERPDDGVPAVHLLDALDRQLPPVTLHHAGVTDLAA